MEELVNMIGVLIVTAVILGLPVLCVLSFILDWNMIIKIGIMLLNLLDLIWVAGTVFEIVDDT